VWCTQVSDYETAYFGNMSAGTGVNYEYSRCAAQHCLQEYAYLQIPAQI
jgi:hypothetical protein